MKHKTITFEMENITFIFKKATPKRFDRMMVNLDGDGKYRLAITGNDGKDIIKFCPEHNIDFLPFLGASLNHEFLHIILGEFVSVRAFDKYDDFLIKFGYYTNTAMMEEWL